MDRLTSMQAFVKAVELGSFSAAGEALRMSSQAIGRHVQSLENRLQVRLLNRSTRRQSLTDVGRSFFDRAKLILSEVELAENVAAEAQSVPSGRLRINAPVTFGMRVLAPALADYMEAYPQVDVELSFSNRVVDFVEEGFDVLFRVAELAESGLVARPLAPYRLVLCASPHYISSHPPILAPKDLSDHECLVFAHTDLRTQWTFKGPGGLIEVPVQGRFMADHGEALLSAAIAGLGVMLQPHELVSDALNNGSLVELLPQFAIPTRSLNLLYAQDRRMTPKLRSFVDFAVTRFGDGSTRLR